MRINKMKLAYVRHEKLGQNLIKGNVLIGWVGEEFYAAGNSIVGG